MKLAPVVPALTVLLAVLAPGVALADAPRESAEPVEMHERHALETALAKEESVARVATGATSYTALCRGSAYAFWLAEPGGDGSSDLAKRALDLADRARRVDATRVEGHYRYALALGIYLRENKLAGITRASDLIEAAERAVTIDETYDRGGPHRILALLYAEAPRLVGPGDHDKARRHLQRLLAIAGDQIENKLVAVRVHAALGEAGTARRLLAAADPETGRDENERKECRAEKTRLAHELDD